MEKYIALLRGVNVGGNNKIAMPELRILLEKNGFCGAETYINSGNVVFSSDIADEVGLKRRCEALIAEKFGLNIAVAVISAADLRSALGNAPDWWDADAESKHNAIFIIPPATAESVLKAVGEAKPEYERVAYSGRMIFWSAPLKTFSKTRWSKIVGTAAYDSVTIRNANTAKKLLQLAGGAAK